MRFWKKIFQFYLGGALYMTLEFLWRGRSHGSMFLLGGSCFLLLGRLGRKIPSPICRALAGSALVTGLELLTGFLVNRDYRVWDYRSLPLNFCGHICLPYSLLWAPLSLLAMALYKKSNRWIDISLRRSKIREKQ